MAVQFPVGTAYASSADNLFNATDITLGFRLLVPSWAAVTEFTRFTQIGDGTEGGIAATKISTGSIAVFAFSAGSPTEVERFAITENQWYSMAVRFSGTGAGSYDRWLKDHTDGTLTTNLNVSSTRSAETGPLGIGAIAGGVAGAGGRFQEFWISHSAVSDVEIEAFVQGGPVPSQLLSFYPLFSYSSGNIADEVGAADLTVTGTPTTTAGLNFGTAAGTLAAATGSATGALTISGAAAGTLVAATGAATGAETFTGTAAGALAAATGAATGVAQVTGTAAGTLAAITGSATGTRTTTIPVADARIIAVAARQAQSVAARSGVIEVAARSGVIEVG